MPEATGTQYRFINESEPVSNTSSISDPVVLTSEGRARGAYLLYLCQSLPAHSSTYSDIPNTSTNAVPGRSRGRPRKERTEDDAPKRPVGRPKKLVEWPTYSHNKVS